MGARQAVTRVHKAAVWPGEADMLAAVVSDLRSDDAKMIYGDWLEEHGDPRGPFLREFVVAFRNNRSLPPSERFPQPWKDLVGVTLLEGVREFDLVEFADALLAAARPALAIDTEEPDDENFALGAGKYGGLPDLPNDAAWPTAGKSLMGFLGQINLAEIAGTQASRELPSQGLLSFFVYNPEPQASYELEHAQGHAIFAPRTDRLRRRKPPGPLSAGNGTAPECALTFSETLDLPADNSIDRGGKRGVKFDPLNYGLHTRQIDRLFGFANVSHYPDGETSSADWRHLFTCSGYCFFIRDVDLRQRRFESVQMIAFEAG